MPTTNKIPNKLGQAGEKVSKVDTKIETPNKKVSKNPNKREDSLPKPTTTITPNNPDTNFKLSTAIKEHRLYKKDISKRNEIAIKTLYKECKQINGKMVPGQLVIFEYMNPLLKEELEYYDARPCTIFFGMFNSANGPREIGFNIHYYPPRMRYAIMNRIYEIYRPVFQKYFDNGIKKEIDGFDYRYLKTALNKAGLGFGIREYVPSLRKKTILVEPKWFSTAVFTEGLFKKQALSQIMGHWRQHKNKDKTIITKPKTKKPTKK